VAEMLALERAAISQVMLYWLRGVKEVTKALVLNNCVIPRAGRGPGPLRTGADAYCHGYLMTVTLHCGDGDPITHAWLVLSLSELPSAESAG
jgi:hypothetical protein